MNVVGIAMEQSIFCFSKSAVSLQLAKSADLFTHCKLAVYVCLDFVVVCFLYNLYISANCSYFR